MDALAMYLHEHGHEPEADDGEGELEETTAEAGDASPDADDVWRTDAERDQPAAATHYAGATSATTVNVITDFDQDIELDKAARESVDARAKAAVKRVSSVLVERHRHWLC